MYSDTQRVSQPVSSTESLSNPRPERDFSISSPLSACIRTMVCIGIISTPSDKLCYPSKTTFSAFQLGNNILTTYSPFSLPKSNPPNSPTLISLIDTILQASTQY